MLQVKQLLPGGLTKCETVYTALKIHLKRVFCRHQEVFAQNSSYRVVLFEGVSKWNRLL